MKQFLQCVLVKLGANYAQTPRIIRASAANLIFLRDKIKLHPTAVGARNDALGPKDYAVFFRTA